MPPPAPSSHPGGSQGCRATQVGARIWRGGVPPLPLALHPSGTHPAPPPAWPRARPLAPGVGRPCPAQVFARSQGRAQLPRRVCSQPGELPAPRGPSWEKCRGGFAGLTLPWEPGHTRTLQSRSRPSLWCQPFPRGSKPSPALHNPAPGHFGSQTALQKAQPAPGWDGATPTGTPGPCRGQDVSAARPPAFPSRPVHTERSKVPVPCCCPSPRWGHGAGTGHGEPGATSPPLPNPAP